MVNLLLVGLTMLTAGLFAGPGGESGTSKCTELDVAVSEAVNVETLEGQDAEAQLETILQVCEENRIEKRAVLKIEVPGTDLLETHPKALEMKALGGDSYKNCEIVPKYSNDLTLQGTQIECQVEKLKVLAEEQEEKVVVEVANQIEVSGNVIPEGTLVF